MRYCAAKEWLQTPKTRKFHVLIRPVEIEIWTLNFGLPVELGEKSVHFMRGSVFQALWKTKSTAHVRPRGRNYDIPQLRVRYNSSTTTPTTNPSSTAVPAKPKKVVWVLLAPADCPAVIVSYTWRSHFPTNSCLASHIRSHNFVLVAYALLWNSRRKKWLVFQISKICGSRVLMRVEEIATLKRELKRELQLQIDKRE